MKDIGIVLRDRLILPPSRRCGSLYRNDATYADAAVNNYKYDSHDYRWVGHMGTPINPNVASKTSEITPFFYLAFKRRLVVCGSTL